MVALLRDDDGRCAGVEFRARDGRSHVIGAGAVILATGGAGQLWRNSTNPVESTGDGVALAWEAGAEVASMEFMQFHPTALALPGAPRFLISEAVRGEGAHVIDDSGRRFLFDTDPRGELAGRDVVARAIWERLVAHGTDHVLLDCRPLGDAVRSRFPTIAATCAAHGIDIATQPIPIAPAAHYLIGGVRTDIDGATSVAGLFACGEVASTGVHGANRLASNSLLEGVGVRPPRSAGRARRHRRTSRLAAPRSVTTARRPWPRPPTPPPPTGSATPCGRAAGWCVTRRACDARWAPPRRCSTPPPTSDSLDDITVRQAATTAALVCRAALLREESRGAHFRADHPSTRDIWHGVLVMQKERGHRLDRNA